MKYGTPFGALGSDMELERFAELQAQLPAISQSYRAGEAPHTSVVVPSISVNQEELAKIHGSAFYEERLLFTLMRLRNPTSRMIYVTSQPIHGEILEYYLQHLPGIPVSRARERLMVVCLYDASPTPLTRKVLERPRVLERMRRFIGDPNRAYLTCYNSTALERRLAVELGIPLHALDPELLWMGTKTGSRRVFAEAGIEFPLGHNDLHTRDDIVGALDELARERRGIRKAVVKLNESFAGEGNAIFRYPDPLPSDPADRRAALSNAIEALEWAGSGETLAEFLRKMDEMGGVVEEWIEGEVKESPSVQMRVHPDRTLEVVSTHDQVLGGPSGQVYLGCRFPADEAYRTAILRAGVEVGRVLARHGVLGRLGVDFVVVEQPDGSWRAYAIEINLRMGGTTPPFMALEFLGGGTLDPETGLYIAADGKPKYYYATDNLKSPAYRGLLPEDLLDLLVEYGIHFKQLSLNGVLFFMIGALSQYGKLGVTSIGDSPDEAEALYETTVDILDRTVGATQDTFGRPRSLFESDAPRMV